MAQITLNSTGVASNGSLVLQSNGTTTALTVDASQNVTLEKNLTFTGTGNRITGDFSNATSANRVTFQSSTTNGNTIVQAMPNGTAIQTQIALFTDSALTNGNFGDITLNNSEFRLRTIALGTGTAVPMTFSIAGSERMRIDTSGNLLVGTTTATGGRIVSEANSFNTSGADNWKKGAFNGRGSFGGPLSFVNTGGASDGFCFYLTGTPSTLNVQFGANGGTPSAGVTLSSTGTSWAAFSDERLKTAIIPFVNPIQKVCTLRAGTGRFLTDKEGLSRSFLIAQDVQAILPEAIDVGQDEQQTLSLRYTDVIPLLVAAIQEQQALIQSLTTRITALEAK